jgi:hypothetical protein
MTHVAHVEPNEKEADPEEMSTKAPSVLQSVEHWPVADAMHARRKGLLDMAVAKVNVKVTLLPSVMLRSVTVGVLKAVISAAETTVIAVTVNWVCWTSREPSFFCKQATYVRYQLEAKVDGMAKEKVGLLTLEPIETPVPPCVKSKPEQPVELSTNWTCSPALSLVPVSVKVMVAPTMA